MKKYTFEKAIYSLNKRIKKYIIKHNIPLREIDKGSATWAGYCLITNRDREIVINNRQSIFLKPFVILHEMGHMLDEDYIQTNKTGIIKNVDFEKTANNYIYYFCRKHCSIVELFMLKSMIENTSKMPLTFSFIDNVKIKFLTIIGIL